MVPMQSNDQIYKIFRKSLLPGSHSELWRKGQLPGFVFATQVSQPIPLRREQPADHQHCHCEERSDVAIYNSKFLTACHYSRRIPENVGINLQNPSKRYQFRTYSRSFSRFFGSNSNGRFAYSPVRDAHFSAHSPASQYAVYTV